MKDLNPTTAAGYHRDTSYRRHRLTPHTLDWRNQPSLTKAYPGLPRIALGKDLNLPEKDYFQELCFPSKQRHETIFSINFQQLSTILYLTHTVTARSLPAGKPFYYRSVASAGALYPFELYLAVHRADGLDAGLYHYDPLEFSLTTLRQGALPPIPPANAAAGITFYVSGIFFRSAWKYRNRAYRYVLLDGGHLLENLRLALDALDYPFDIQLHFDDAQTSQLLGLDPEREVCLACVHLHADAGKMLFDEKIKPLAADVCRASRVSGKEIAYPEILSIHRSGITDAREPVFDRPDMRVFAHPPEEWIDLDIVAPAAAVHYIRVLQRRRSRRNFIPAPVSREEFMTFLKAMGMCTGQCSGMPAAFRSAVATGILVGEKMPVPSGFYLLDAEHRRLGKVVAGDLIEAMAAACLDQMWLKHAGLHLCFMTDPAALDRSWGARGYRYAMLEAGRLGQQAYLAATALGWGACGIGAIYDREAAELLQLTDDGALLYLVGVGPLKTR
jgi:SagB-type dehydrogenase family enzyme